MLHTMSTSLASKFAIIMVFTIMAGAWPCLSHINRTVITCNEEDREGLIKFKQTLLDPYNLLSSWKNEEDCCKWRGVTCHKVTGRVIKLKLRLVPRIMHDYVEVYLSSYVEQTCGVLGVRELSSGLVSLRYLSHLDLRGIWYTNTTIVPSFFGSMKRLKHLHLEGNSVINKVACDRNGRQGGELDYLLTDTSDGRLVVDDVSWLSHLQALESLQMDGILFEKPHEFMEVINNDLPFLSHLGISGCFLQNSHVSHLNTTFLSRLQYLDLSWNNLDGQIPSAIGNMTFLQHLDLSYNNFRSQFPVSFGDRDSLVYIDIGGSTFENIADGLPTLLKNNQNLKSLRAACLYRPQLPQMAFSNNHSSGSIGGSLELLQLTSCGIPGSLPIWFQDMKRLEYSLLSGNLFQGSIPTLPNLKVIDLSSNGLDVVNITSFAKLQSLESLMLSENMLKVDIFDSLCTLRNLRKLDVASNHMNGRIPATISKLMALESIGLGNNNLQGSIPESLGTLPNLRQVDLSSNYFDGVIPSSLGELTSLDTLFLGDNRLEGNIPDSLGHLSTLRILDLSHNRLNGTIPITIAKLFNLESLILYENSFRGMISESHFSNLSKLKVLDIGRNNLTFKVRSDWVPPFQLRSIGLGSCNLEKKFPRWIQTQRSLHDLILSNAGINEPIPNWLSDLQLGSLDLSHNDLIGELQNFSSIYLFYLDLSDNSIHGHLPLNISETFPLLWCVYLSSNSISGTLPPSLCDMERLEFLDLSKNNLSGSIPDCWRNTSRLEHINLSSNKFCGVIPKSLVYIPDLLSLHLNNNHLFGRLPKYLERWPRLILLDLGENNLSGNLPSSIVMSQNLRVLRLRGNKFHGIIPRNFCSLYNLQILDLAANNLTGSIPSCFENMNGMKRGHVMVTRSFLISLETKIFAGRPTWEIEDVSEVMKGKESVFTKITQLLVNLDLSSNHLVGPIPIKLVTLNGLIGLNLSHNHLSGNIPSNIENFTLLESLDLSNNQLSGQIPHGLSSLTALSYLNLSNNNLSGHVPQGTQISTIYDEHPSIFSGNPYLCGDPLPWKCNADGTEPPEAPKSTPTMKKRERVSDEFILYIVVAVGYATGFWGVIFVLIFKRSWRIACFKFVDEIVDKVYVAVLVKLAKFHRR